MALSAMDVFARALVEISRAAQTDELDDLLRLILKRAQETVGAEAVSLALVDEASGDLYFHTIAGGSRKVEAVRVPQGRGIVGRVARDGVTINVAEASQCPDFYAEVDKKTGFRTRQVLCVPLAARGKRIGALEAVNKRGASRFGAEDELLFTTFAGNAASAIETARLARRADFDALTGARNRAYFDAWLADKWRLAERLDKPLSALLIDVDRFKSVNDELGHAAGDAVLKRLARLIESSVRKSDLLARYGGEEFVLVLPETSAARALKAAERLRAAVARHDFGLGRPITISLGLAERLKGKPGSPADLLARCDLALYRAKIRRNCVAA